jgi:hypothetical protein
MPYGERVGSAILYFFHQTLKKIELNQNNKGFFMI